MAEDAAQSGKKARRSRAAPRSKDAEDESKPRGACMVALRRAFFSILRLADRGIDCVMGWFHVGMRILGPCLICVATGLISYATYTYFVYVLPQLEPYGLPARCSITCLGMFLLGNTLYNYGCSIFMDAGTPPEYDKAMAERGLELEEAAERPKQCQRCNRLKPARCHHCSVCRRCVLKMDHHCPWINNCVGHRNYRHFCLFMLFLAMSCCFAVVVFAAPFAESLYNGGFRAFRRRLPREARQCIMTSVMICLSILVALSILGGFHVYLVLSNQTTIEFQTNLVRRRIARQNGEYYRNPYDCGRTRNFQQVFGPNPICRLRWLLPYLAHAPTGTGMDYPSMTRFRSV